MEILIIEDEKEDSKKVKEFVENPLFEISKATFPEIFKEGFTTTLKESKRDAEEYIDSLEEDDKKNILLAFVDLSLPDVAGATHKMQHGFDILKKMKKNSLPVVILSQYINKEDTFANILKNYGSFSTLKEKGSFFSFLDNPTFKKSEAQSILLLAMNAHPVYSAALELKKCITEKFEDLPKIAKEVSDYLKKPPSVLEIKFDRITGISPENLRVEVKNEFALLKAVIIHTPGKEVEDIKPTESEEFLMDKPVNFKTFKDHYGKFKELLLKANKKIQLLEAKELLKWVLDSSPDIKARFALEIVKEDRLAPHFFPKFCKMEVDELMAFAIQGKRDPEDEDNWILKPIPNLMFTRDWGFVIHNNIFAFNPKKPARKREKIIAEFIFRYHPLFKNNYVHLELAPDETIEGGDVILLNEEIVIIGLSDRTTLPAIRKLAKEVITKTKVEVVIATEAQLLLPRGMHLDTYLAVLGENKFLAFAKPFEKEDQVFYIFNKENVNRIRANPAATPFGKLINILKDKTGVDWDPIWVKKEQDFNEDGCNVVSLAQKEVIIYERAEDACERVKNKGFKLHKLDGYELVYLRGGPHCMTQPILRED